MLKLRLFKDLWIGRIMLVLTILSIATMVVIGIGLYIKAAPIMESRSLYDLIFSSDWRPAKGMFGFYPYIIGTLYVTLLSILIAFPLCLMAGIFLFEYAPVRLKNFIAPIIDLLAGVPPVIYGVWGTLTIVPLLSETVAPHFVEWSTGYSVLAGAIVLAVMIFPLIISIMGEVFAAIPNDLRDASLSLGATKWQTTKFVVLRKALPGIVAAVVLALSRAFGETIAVLMVCGNIAEVPKTLFDSCYPLPALIANNYGEMLSVPMYDSALMFAALLLFVIIVVFNLVSRLTLSRLEKQFKL